METALGTLLPVFAVIATGYALASLTRVDVRTLADLALWVTSPALLFSLLAGTHLEPDRLGALVGGTLAIASGTALLAFGYVRATGVGRGFVLPAVFWNGGNMGLACARLAYGTAGLEAAAVPFVVAAMLSSFFGIWIAKGENGLVESLRMPLLWAAAAGLALSTADVTLPRLLMEPIEMLGAMAIPLMLVNLGVQLHLLHVSDVGHSFAAVAIRMLGGPVFALLFVTLAGVHGVDRGVLLLHAVMPAAVINAVMAQRYDTDASLVASSIVIGTLASVATIPLALLLA